MRPIKLELSGLNSYTDKQIVDFEKLTERGLFGIFGPTGSGKSTILDAITLAMYGNISRNTKEFINSSSKGTVLSYEFEIGTKNNKRRYLVDRNMVNSKTGTKTSYARLVEILNDGNKNVLADKVGEVNEKIAEVIGLTANDFTRSVVLPQGKFSEFLQLTGSERRDMLERIFKLEKYGRGLSEKVKRRKNFNLRNLYDINSKLTQYDEVSQEAYESVIRELEELKLIEKSNTEDVNKLQKIYEEDKITYDQQNKLSMYKTRLKDLESKRDEIKDKKISIEKSKKASMIEPHIIYFENLNKKIAEDSNKLDVYEKDSVFLKRELESIKSRYDEILKSKFDDIPKMSQEKIRLEYALKLENELQTIEEEIEKLVSDKNEYSNSKIILEKRNSELEVNLKSIVNNIDRLENQLEEIYISVDLKQKIFYSYDMEKEYNKVSEEKKIKFLKLDNLLKEYDEFKSNSKFMQRNKTDILSELESKESHLEFIMTKCPGSNDDILEKSKKIVELKGYALNLDKSEKRRDILQDEVNEILENVFKLGKEISELKIEKEKIEEKKSELEEEIDKFKILNQATRFRENLKEGSPCPVCGSFEHSEVESINYDPKIEFLENKLDKMNIQHKEVKDKIEGLSLKQNSLEYAHKLKSEEFENIKLNIGDNNSSRIFQSIEQEKKGLDMFKVSFENWQNDKQECEKKILELKDRKNSVDIEESKLDEGISSKGKVIEELKNEVEAIEKKYISLKNEYLSNKTSLRIENFGEKVEKIKENEKEIERLSTSLTVLKLDKESIEKDLNESKNRLYEVNINLNKLEDLYLDKKNTQKTKTRELSEITKGKPANSLLDEIVNCIEKIYEEENSTSKELDGKKEEYERNDSNRNILKASLAESRAEYIAKEESLKEIIVVSGFKDIYKIKGAIIDADELYAIENEVKDFNEEEKFINLRIGEFDDKVLDKTIKEDDLVSIKNKIDNLKQEVSSISKKIGAGENKEINLRESLEKVKVLTEQLKLVQHQVDLLDDLDRTIQGNKFVEYVATNQLKYISLEASNRLDSITKGRYALEIDDRLNFVMRDNFNGGERRSVDTLSGGETFLTSLALALALSSQIQLKGKAPLQFFFLDEGFGSLDAELLEIVMESLERLHGNGLSIGIISHVEELKNRVPIKLLVSPSKSGVGSKTHIEYS
ncbi:SbcC/MukB-like Walker B domain-containing protein [Metaclostridioides mangenotii]|uniref:Nuclease SbcCD subunit C n=2 Tax=Metaclostridioides mangenotii TaxID=1540 RepID=A0ABS4EEA8_9FIRM|nr:SMC family ATPase [Clostridioides mangenotii]MBP1856273.1 exonuclease SbcC [Clostridioides mangenotii]